MTSDERFLILNPVEATRASEFEAFVRDVLQPAVQAQQPDIAHKVRLWRASEPEPGASIIIFAFVAEGISSWDDLNLLPVFTAQYGEAEALDLLDTFGSFFVEGREWATAWAAAVAADEGAQQYGWQMNQVWPQP